MPFELPSYIRYFADTSDGATGKVALEYLRSLIRIAPVKLVSISGGLAPAWRAFEGLLLTPMTGTYVNVVCTLPDRWIWKSSVPMTERDESLEETFDVVLANPRPKAIEHAERVEELYTPKAMRNVILVASSPVTDDQFRSMKKYDDIIIPALPIVQTMIARWPESRIEGGCVPIPVTNHARVREAIVGRV